AADRDEGHVSLRNQRLGFAQRDGARMADAGARMAQRSAKDHRGAFDKWRDTRGMESGLRFGSRISRELGHKFAMAIARRSDAGKGFGASKQDRHDDHGLEHRRRAMDPSRKGRRALLFQQHGAVVVFLFADDWVV